MSEYYPSLEFEDPPPQNAPASPRHPVQFPHFIRLEVKEQLPEELARKWLSLVKEFAPPGTVIGYSVNSEKSEPTVTQLMMSKLRSGDFNYDIPLARDLLERELDTIGAAWAERHPERDEDIFSCSGCVIEDVNDEELPSRPQLTEDQWKTFCFELAKIEHNRWVANLAERGWKWGTTRSKTNKTHPMLRPFDMLPEPWRKVDEKLPQRVLELLEQQGYIIIPKNVFERLTETSKKK